MRRTSTANVYLADVAKELNVDRNFLLKKLKREKVAVAYVLAMTAGGVQRCAVIPAADAIRLRNRYAEARANTRS
jgi:hypothetical protein